MKKVIVFMMLLLPCVAFGANKDDKVINFQFYGSDLQVHFDASKRVKVKKNDSVKVVKCVDIYRG